MPSPAPSSGPARGAGVRLATSALAGALLMIWLDRFAVAAVFGLQEGGKNLHLGAVGLGLAASVGAWCELALLRRALGRRLAELRLPAAAVARQLALAVALALPGLAVWALLPLGVVAAALVVLPCYVACYLGFAWWTRAPELELWLGRLRR